MIGRWLRHLIWHPYEISCRRLPLLPLQASVESPCDGVALIRISNVVTRLVSALGGGYDYSVSYLVDGSLLIDTGFPWARRSLRKTLVALGADRTLKTVVNTHAHEDHTGNNDLLAELTAVEIYAHPLTVARLRHPGVLPWYRSFMFGPVVPTVVAAVPDILRTARFTFHVHHLPGHSPDHICLLEPTQGWLFSGDLYVSAQLDSQLQEVDGPSWVRSLERAIEMGASWLFDAHGTVVSGEAGVRAVLTQKRDFLLALAERVRLASQGEATVAEITRQVFGTKGAADALSLGEGWLSLLTCSDFSRRHLVASFLGPGPRGERRGSVPAVPD